MHPPRFAAITLVALFATALAPAHELELTVTPAAPAMVIRATYAGTEPVPFAKVQVFSPAGGAAFQESRTDRRGYFSFVPEGPGAWRIIVDDEEGHKREIPVGVPDPFTAASAMPGASTVPRWERALTGVALLAGITGVLYGVKARRQARAIRRQISA